MSEMQRTAHITYQPNKHFFELVVTCLKTEYHSAQMLTVAALSHASDNTSSWARLDPDVVVERGKFSATFTTTGTVDPERGRRFLERALELFDAHDYDTELAEV